MIGTNKRKKLAWERVVKAFPAAAGLFDYFINTNKKPKGLLIPTEQFTKLHGESVLSHIMYNAHDHRYPVALHIVTVKGKESIVDAHRRGSFWSIAIYDSYKAQDMSTLMEKNAFLRGVQCLWIEL